MSVTVLWLGCIGGVGFSYKAFVCLCFGDLGNSLSLSRCLSPICLYQSVHSVFLALSISLSWTVLPHQPTTCFQISFFLFGFGLRFCLVLFLNHVFVATHRSGYFPARPFHCLFFLCVSVSMCIRDFQSVSLILFHAHLHCMSHWVLIVYSEQLSWTWIWYIVKDVFTWIFSCLYWGGGVGGR